MPRGCDAMDIKFQCPHCGGTYQAPESMAGKKITCRRENCRLVIEVPTTSTGGNGTAAKPAPVRKPVPAGTGTAPPPPPDADALAASLLSEEQPTPDQIAAAEGKPIPVQCPSCDHKFEVGRDKADKNVVCPECTYRFKVVVKEETKPRDWREGKKRLLEKDDQPDDVWSAQATTAADRKSLKEAGALLADDEDEEGPSIFARLTKWTLALAGIAAVAFGVIYLRNTLAVTEQQSRIDDALQALRDAESEMPPTWAAAVWLSAGEHDLHYTETWEEFTQARDHLNAVRGNLTRASNSAERDLLVARLAVAQLGLAGDEQAVKEDRGLDWNKLQTELRQTMQRLTADPDRRAYAFRELARGLIPTGETMRAVPVAQTIAGNTAPDLIGVIGIELFQAGKRELADQTWQRARALPSSGAAPSLQALAMALQGPDASPDQMPRFVDPPSPTNSAVESRRGFALGFALQGKTEDALRLAQDPGNPEHRVRALVDLAEVFIKSDPGFAGQALEAARGILINEVKNQKIPSWLPFRVALLSAQVGEIDPSFEVCEVIADPGLKAWAQMEAMRGHFATEPDEEYPANWLDKVGTEKDLGHALAREAWVRQNVSAGGSYDDVVEEWSATMKPFGYAGIALGIQSKGDSAE